MFSPSSTSAAGGSSLSASTRQLLLHIARAAMPEGGRFPAPGPQTIERYGEFIAGQPRQAQFALDSLARVLDNYPRLGPGRGRSFSSMGQPARVAFLRQLWGGSYLERMLLRVVTAPLKVAHYTNPDIFEAAGATFKLPPVAQTERPRYMELAMDAGELEAGEVIEAEVVVVGSGAGGAAMAAELAEQGCAVVLVEEGQYFGREHFTGRAMDMLQSMYRMMGATGTVGNTYIPVPMGVTVGGTTTVNSGTCYRAPDRVLARWRAEYGLDQFTPAAMDPFFSKVENVLQVTPADPKYLGGIADVIARGCDALGWRDHGPLPRNAPDCDGQGLCPFGCPTDAKRSTNISYVPLALRYGANLISQARVTRLLLERGRAVGVQAVGPGGRQFTVRAAAVVLSAGTMMTPSLLLKNGLANASGQVGRNLSIHPAVGICGLFPEQIRGYSNIPQGYGVEEFHDDGLLFEGAYVPIDLCAGSLTIVGPRFTEVMEQVEQLGYFGFLIEDTSRGRVSLGPGGVPVMTYFMNDQDVAQLKRGTELLMRIFLAGGARGIFPMVPGFEEVHDLRDVERFRRAELRARDFELTAHHPLGTCRMGLDPRSSVVGPDHQCHDVPGLYIADGSSVPSSLGVNPQITIMAMATRAARFVADFVEREAG